MDFGIIAGDTDKTIYVRLRDSTTGLAKTGLAYNSAGAVASYVLPGAARAAITLATQTVTGAHSDGGFVEVDATNCKGLYRLDLPDAAIASGAFSLISIEFDATIEETVIVPLSLRKSDLRQIGGDTQSQTDLKYFADAGYDPSTNKVQGVVLVDAVTALGSTALAAIAIAIIEAFGGTIGAVEDDAGNSSSQFQTGMAEAADDYYNGGSLVFTSGTNANQVRRITDYAGSTGTITVDPAFDDEPGTGDQFLIVGRIQ